QSEQEALKGAVHPLIRTIPRSLRRSLYVASHASRIIDWPVPEGRLLLRDLIEHASKPEFVYRHSWRVGDLVIWDNRCTMHRARPFDDTKYRRELRRVTTLDIPEPARPAREYRRPLAARRCAQARAADPGRRRRDPRAARAAAPALRGDGGRR